MNYSSLVSDAIRQGLIKVPTPHAATPPVQRDRNRDVKVLLRDQIEAICRDKGEVRPSDIVRFGPTTDRRWANAMLSYCVRRELLVKKRAGRPGGRADRSIRLRDLEAVYVLSPSNPSAWMARLKAAICGEFVLLDEEWFNCDTSTAKLARKVFYWMSTSHGIRPRDIVLFCDCPKPHGKYFTHISQAPDRVRFALANSAPEFVKSIKSLAKQFKIKLT